VIPAELRAEFKVAVDLRDGSTDDLWTDFCAMYERVARHIDYSSIVSYDGMNLNIFQIVVPSL
jgi:hypothetical protein